MKGRRLEDQREIGPSFRENIFRKQSEVREEDDRSIQEGLKRSTQIRCGGALILRHAPGSFCAVLAWYESSSTATAKSSVKKKDTGRGRNTIE